MVNSAGARRGRPAGGSDARERLLAATVNHLEAGTLQSTSTRQLAREAGVSHTLVNYHFGSRTNLLVAATALRVAPHDVLAASITAQGLDLSRLFGAIVDLWDDARDRDTLRGVVLTAQAHAPGADAIVDYLEREVADRLAAVVGRAQARRILIVVAGVISTRWMMGLAPIARLERDELVRTMVSLVR